MQHDKFACHTTQMKSSLRHAPSLGRLWLYCLNAVLSMLLVDYDFCQAGYRS